MGAVAVIDMAPVLGDAAGKRAVAEQVGRACREIGFFQIVGHGVPQAVSDAAWDDARAFFDLPLAERMRVAMPTVGYPYGYSPVENEGLAFSLGDVSPPDLKESLAVGPLDRPASAQLTGDEAFAYSPNLWPARPPGLEASWRAYYRAMEGLASRLMGIFALALGLPETWFAGKIDRHISAMRALNYPDQPDPPAPGQLRAGAHTDYGSLTILRQDSAPGGLEVRGLDGTWRPVPAIPGAFVINIGDLMQRWTNDRWVSTLHRVVNPDRRLTGSTRRQSFAFFHQPNWDAEIACIPTCLAPGESPKYPPIASGPYLMGKFRSTVEFTAPPAGLTIRA